MNPEQQTELARALGIDVWVARKPLGGAADNHRIALTRPLPAAIPAAPQQQPGSSTDTSQQGRGLALAQTLVAQNRPPVTQSLPAKGTSQASHAISSGGAFELFALVHQGVLLVDDISHLRFTPSAYSQWLSAVFSAMGVPANNLVIEQSSRISWPLAQYAKQYDPAEMVRAWLNKKIATAQSAQAMGCAIAMGEQTAQLLGLQTKLGETASLAQMEGLPALQSLESAQLWQQPCSKREFWQQLQALQKTIVTARKDSQ